MRASSESVPATVTEPTGRKPDSGGALGDVVPEVSGPEGELQLGAPGPAADPDEPEVPDRGPAGPGIGLEMGDLPSPVTGMQGVHRADDPAPHDHRTLQAHRSPIVVIRRPRRPGRPPPQQCGCPSVAVSPSGPGGLNWRFAHSGVAQLAARMILVHEVGGSSPPPRALAVLPAGVVWQILRHTRFMANEVQIKRSTDRDSTRQCRIIRVPSSRGLGHHPLKVETRVRTPLGLPEEPDPV